jgi:hypothetical protein
MTIRQTFGLEVVKRVVVISIGLWEASDWASWRSRSPPKQKKTSQTQPSEKKKWQYACRLFMMNSLKEGAM